MLAPSSFSQGQRCHISLSSGLDCSREGRALGQSKRAQEAQPGEIKVLDIPSALSVMLALPVRWQNELVKTDVCCPLESQGREARQRCSRRDGVRPALDVLQVLAPKVSGVHGSVQPWLPSVILVAIVLVIQQRLPVRTPAPGHAGRMSVRHCRGCAGPKMHTAA